MKRVYSFLLLAFVAMLSVPASAQIKFGLKGGVDLTQMKLNHDVIDKDNRAGFYIGPTVKLTLLDTGVGFDISAIYDQRSAKVGADDEEDKYDVTLTQKQIAIPINVRYAFGIGSTANVFLFAGPQFGFNVGGDKKLSDVDWKWKDSNFSVNVGVGCTLFTHLQINANYNIACGKTGEVKNAFDVADKTVSNIHARYNAWQIGLAYYF